MRRGVRFPTKRLARGALITPPRASVGAASTMRGSRASQSETAILPCRSGRQCLLPHDVEAGGFQPLRHGLGGETEPAMGVLLAQKFEIVRREIDDQQPAAGPQHAHRFADGARGVVEKVQHLVNDDDVERIARQREIVDVALPHAAIFQAGAVEPRAGQRQHVERKIEAEAALDIAGEQFQHAAGAGAEIEQRADRLVGERGADRVLHRGVGDMQLADAVPLGGVPAEIILRGGGARGAHRGEPFAVARDDRIVGIEPRDHGAGDIGGAAALAEPEKCPRAFAEALDQPGLGKQPQMARQPRLRLAQDLGEVGDGQLGLGDQRQDAQPRRFSPAALSIAVRSGKREWSLSIRCRPKSVRLDIKISLYD